MRESSQSRVTGRERSTARFFAVQALFQMEARGQSCAEVVEEFLNHRFGHSFDEVAILVGDADLFAKLVNDAITFQALIDQMTERALVSGWPIARIDPTLRGIFRAASAELLGRESPPKVIINEFIDIARAFFLEGREVKFVNAVLDTIARDVQERLNGFAD
ncbi:MAG: transcription antitermination factor NusB [Aestuariivita sp.]|nr:transcription antitermination factor NusB [Aestuariivita sp.]MCY4203668.1 transcription antitermination factor NusB [Aestuariivita sp.]MCY4287143.1 transcription antitermination factor NusB [Aestuariivita sp.]MCY4345458.1 transcription antitermination factor NusB [Aestuariivita sp.]